MKEAGLLQALCAFETIVEKAQTECAAAEATKDRLNRRQQDLLDQEQEMIAALDDHRMLDPLAFRFRDVRLRRVDQIRNRLQPDLAKAAIDALTRKEELVSALRSRVALELTLEEMRKKAARSGDRAAEELALFELGKRGQ